MRILSIVGARPQFVKLAPICRAVAEHNAAGGVPLEHLIVHTGQHYDPGLSDIFFEELEIPRADVNLGIGSGPHGQQTGRILEQFERVLLELKPNAVFVYGDTNTTIAGALAAAKQHIPVAHIEAGLRSFNRRMPEELNRIATDHLSDLLFAPTQTAMMLLGKEGLSQRALLTGDVGYDAVLFNRELARRKSRILDTLPLQPRSYGVLTLHRAENTDSGHLPEVFDVLQQVATDMPLVFPIHPRTARLLPQGADFVRRYPGIRLIEPVGYLDMLQLTAAARMVLTDSGGLQKEAFFLNVPCITLREETEWIETVTAQANVLTGLDQARLLQAFGHWNERLRNGERFDFCRTAGMPFGDGRASAAIVKATLNRLKT